MLGFLYAWYKAVKNVPSPRHPLFVTGDGLWLSPPFYSKTTTAKSIFWDSFEGNPKSETYLSCIVIYFSYNCFVFQFTFVSDFNLHSGVISNYIHEWFQFTFVSDFPYNPNPNLVDRFRHSRYLFGKDPKLMSTPFRLTKEMVEAMGGTEAPHYTVFKSLCCQVGTSLNLWLTSVAFGCWWYVCRLIF